MTRIVELVLGLLALLLVGLTVYLVVNSVQAGELTIGVVSSNLGLTYVLVFLVAVVGLFALRLLVPGVRRNNRLISRQGIAAFGVVMTGLALVSWRTTGHFPRQAAVFLFGVIMGLVVPTPKKPDTPSNDSRR